MIAVTYGSGSYFRNRHFFLKDCKNVTTYSFFRNEKAPAILKMVFFFYVCFPSISLIMKWAVLRAALVCFECPEVGLVFTTSANLFDLLL